MLAMLKRYAVKSKMVPRRDALRRVESVEIDATDDEVKTEERVDTLPSSIIKSTMVLAIVLTVIIRRVIVRYDASTDDRTPLYENRVMLERLETNSRFAENRMEDKTFVLKVCAR